ncbi:MAG: 4Fe-4S binding protein [Desulfobacterales bacterium]|nr:nitroreductase family protein [Deltaproteobacteria bacterium]NNK93900.1 4Fe-4S binding protein [Desulfobacterales bacterium]
MSHLELPAIDADLCVACNECIGVCPDRILETGVEGDIVVRDEQCMLCGHCQAVCPVEAIAIPALTSHLGLQTIDEEQVSGLPGVSTAALLQVMRARRSCRLFTNDPVELSLLADLVKIGTTAPSGTNSQGWQFVILPKRADVKRLGEATAAFYRDLNKKAANPLYRLISRLVAGKSLSNYYKKYYVTIKQGIDDWDTHGVDRLFHGASAAIVVAADQSASCPAEDSLLATQNILLAAQSMGLGTCLIGFVVEAAKRDKRIPTLLQLGDNEHIYSVIACGYSAVTYKRAAGRRVVTPIIIT